MFILKIFSFLFICILASCGNSVSQLENTNQSQKEEKTELFLIMKRSVCFGNCPIYDLTINSDGRVIFNGVDYTKIKGKFESNLEREKIKQLIDEIEKARFFSLENVYDSNSSNCPFIVTDSPNVTLYIKLNGKEKIINHYLGCWESDRPNSNNFNNSRDEYNWSPTIFPQQLYNLENKIDEIVGTKRWIGERK